MPDKQNTRIRQYSLIMNEAALLTVLMFLESAQLNLLALDSEDEALVFSFST